VPAVDSAVTASPLQFRQEPYSASRLASAVVITMPGNIFLPAIATGLPRDSVVNATALVTLNRSDLVDWVGQVPANLMRDVDRRVRRVLDL